MNPAISNDVRDILYIKADPSRIRQIIFKIRRLRQQAKLEGATKYVKEIESLLHELKKTSVVTANGDLSIDSVINSIISNHNTNNETVKEDNPFKVLEQIPVSDTDTMPSLSFSTKVKDLVPPIIEKKQGELFIPATIFTVDSHDFLLYWEYEYEESSFYNWYWASTSAYVQGMAAASIVGGLYGEARRACESLVVPSAENDNQFIIGFIKAAACNYARETPKTLFTALEIQTIVCSDTHRGLDGHCHFVNAGFETDTILGAVESGSCNYHTRQNVHAVDVEHWEGFGSVFPGLASRHGIRFTNGIETLYVNCP
jgi:hypothetical protein